MTARPDRIAPDDIDIETAANAARICLHSARLRARQLGIDAGAEKLRFFAAMVEAMDADGWDVHALLRVTAEVRRITIRDRTAAEARAIAEIYRRALVVDHPRETPPHDIRAEIAVAASAARGAFTCPEDLAAAAAAIPDGAPIALDAFGRALRSGTAVKPPLGTPPHTGGLVAQTPATGGPWLIDGNETVVRAVPTDVARAT